MLLSKTLHKSCWSRVTACLTVLFLYALIASACSPARTIDITVSKDALTGRAAIEREVHVPVGGKLKLQLYAPTGSTSSWEVIRNTNREVLDTQVFVLSRAPDTETRTFRALSEGQTDVLLRYGWLDVVLTYTVLVHVVVG